MLVTIARRFGRDTVGVFGGGTFRREDRRRPEAAGLFGALFFGVFCFVVVFFAVVFLAISIK